MISDPRIINYIDNLKPDIKEQYLVLYHFILDISPKIEQNWKYNMPFFTSNGLLVYINLDKKRKKWYYGFASIQFIDHTKFNILEFDEKSWVGKWFYESHQQFENDKPYLRIICEEIISYNHEKNRK